MTAWVRGFAAEYLAMGLLWLKGYRVRAHRYKTPVGEIDVVATKRATLVILEVKYRQQNVQEAISSKQRERLLKAARYVLAGLGDSGQGVAIRFDAILVSPWRWPQHIENAWHE